MEVQKKVKDKESLELVMTWWKQIKVLTLGGRATTKA